MGIRRVAFRRPRTPLKAGGRGGGWPFGFHVDRRRSYSLVPMLDKKFL
jgi:hypothetical protein